MQDARRLWPVLALTAGLLGQTTPTDAPDRTPSDFVRFVKEGNGGHLDTAITTYRKGDVEVVLYGAVHIADQACYEALNDRFTTRDALLYELVGPADYRPSKDRERGANPLSLLQSALKNSMQLAFQLDAVDYSPANFVHADMTPEEFQAAMAERGESILSLMLDMMMRGASMQRQKQENGETVVEDFDLVKAFQSGEGRHRLRVAFASQLEELEAMTAGGKDGGSTLLEGRNEKCLEVLQREIAAGKKKIGIYYGAAHLPHMEHRLVDDLGFAKAGHEWLVAWDCSFRPDPKYDRERIKQRRAARDDLRSLARAARGYRLQHGGEPPGAEALAQDLVDGKPRHAGATKDPWGNAYVVEKRAIGARWQVRSAGADGVPGNDDDLVEQEPRGGGLRWW